MGPKKAQARRLQREERYAEPKNTYQTNIRQVSTSHTKKIHVTVLIEGSPCSMEIDTGSSLSIVSWATIRKLVPGISKKQLEFQRIQLKDYQGNCIPVIGSGTFQVAFKKFKGPLKLTVVGVLCQACSAWTGSHPLAWG